MLVPGLCSRKGTWLVDVGWQRMAPVTPASSRREGANAELKSNHNDSHPLKASSRDGAWPSPSQIPATLMCIVRFGAALPLQEFND